MCFNSYSTTWRSFLQSYCNMDAKRSWKSLACLRRFKFALTHMDILKRIYSLYFNGETGSRWQGAHSSGPILLLLQQQTTTTTTTRSPCQEDRLLQILQIDTGYNGYRFMDVVGLHSVIYPVLKILRWTLVQEVASYEEVYESLASKDLTGTRPDHDQGTSQLGQ
ncbi:MAG: hypothetical protein J3Q66DRAFT_331738 [Benniella sp.]|nr:MAG: hypothetical protein J3Q66DRAFT_331738 [Benniella sp.]